MKKVILALVLVSSSIYAAGTLFQEFERRKSTLQSKDTYAVYRIIKKFGRSHMDLVEIEKVVEGEKYATKDKNDEVCLVDILDERIECYNSIGLGTFFAGGDND